MAGANDHQPSATCSSKADGVLELLDGLRFYDLKSVSESPCPQTKRRFADQFWPAAVDARPVAVSVAAGRSERNGGILLGEDLLLDRSRDSFHSFKSFYGDA